MVCVVRGGYTVVCMREGIFFLFLVTDGLFCFTRDFDLVQRMSRFLGRYAGEMHNALKSSFCS